MVSIFSEVTVCLFCGWKFPKARGIGASIILNALGAMMLVDVLVNWDVLLLDQRYAEVKLKIRLLLWNLHLPSFLGPVAELLLDGYGVQAIGHIGGFLSGFFISFVLRNHILTSSGVLCPLGKPYRWYMQWMIHWVICWCLCLGLVIPLVQISKRTF